MAKRGQTRETLLLSLRGVFESRGFDGATLAQLAAASSLSKASLYHHFPGGKSEMAAVLLRDAVAELERLAFSKLASTQPPRQRLENFVDGFREYVRDGEGNCLIRVMAEGSLADQQRETIFRQYADWTRRVASAYRDAGMKTKKAERSATELLASLYGHLITTQLLGQPTAFRTQAKKLKKRLPG